MRFRFIGDPRHGGEGPASVTFGDVTIGRVDFVDVPDELAGKLAQNDHFEREPEAPVAAHGAADKETLIAEAESLGVDVDRRWSVKTLEAEIDKALAANG